MNLHETEYHKYALRILEGEIPSCETIHLACERYISWFDREDIYFDQEHVDYLIRFIAKLKQFEGAFKDKPLILQPWQQFVIANIFGWKWKNTNYRVTREAFIFTPRKSGKTTFMAALAIVGGIADDENGAEIDFVANSRKQAELAFKHCKNFAQSLDPDGDYLRIYKHGRIYIDEVQSNIQILASDSMKLDGYNSHFCIYDEIHASKNYDLYNVMKDSMGSRRQPLMLIISTAGFLLDGYPCFEMKKTNTDILRGVYEDDSVFSMIFQLDEGDDWEDETTWQKVQPSLDLTVTRDKYKEYVRRANINPSLTTDILTKIFNKFCNSANTWLPASLVYNSSVKVDMDKLKGERCFMGLDMSSTNDFTAQSILFPPNPMREYYPDKYIFKSWVYIPKGTLDTSVNASLYKEWVRNKQVELTDSNVVQYDVILDKQLEINEEYDITGIYYDAYRASGWAIMATERGLYLEPFPQTMGPFTKPTTTFSYLINTNQVIIDANSCVLWCFNNAELKYGGGGDEMICKPVKSGGVKSKKIDPVISMLEALGGYMASPYGNQIEITV